MSILNRFNRKPNPINYKNKKIIIWNMMTILVITIFLLIISCSLYFAYNNIYLTLNNAQTIFLLESKLGSENIDIKNFEISQQKIKTKKEEIIIPENLRNLFEYQISQNTTNTQEFYE